MDAYVGMTNMMAAIAGALAGGDKIKPYLRQYESFLGIGKGRGTRGGFQASGTEKKINTEEVGLG
jgi:hypothetical protein